jgi:peptidoglycan hydrolase CwlO-like protein
MKKFSFFLIVLLIVLGISLAVILQNNSSQVGLKFLFWTLPNASVGLLAIMLFLAGFVSMWLITLMLYVANTLRTRRVIGEKDSLIKSLEQEKENLKKQLDEKINELQSKIKEIETKFKEVPAPEKQDTENK